MLPLQHQFVGDGHDQTLRRPRSSSLRTQAPITTGANCNKGNGRYRLFDKPRRMGPGVRRDDG